MPDLFKNLYKPVVLPEDLYVEDAVHALSTTESVLKQTRRMLAPVVVETTSKERADKVVRKLYEDAGCTVVRARSIPTTRATPISKQENDIVRKVKSDLDSLECDNLIAFIKSHAVPEFFAMKGRQGFFIEPLIKNELLSAEVIYCWLLTYTKWPLEVVEIHHI
jgi:hypothetical protein